MNKCDDCGLTFVDKASLRDHAQRIPAPYTVKTREGDFIRRGRRLAGETFCDRILDARPRIRRVA